MKIGIFGGSFNPPHMGHLIVIESVRDQLQFDRIIFVPSANPPNKRNVILAPAEKRLEMTGLATGDHPDFAVSDIEVRRDGLSYTIDTIRMMKSLHPGDALSLILGSDNVLEFSTWKSPEEIIDLVELVAMGRPGAEIRSAGRNFARFAKFVTVPQIGISGTDIRRRVKLNRSIRYLVPARVEEYIHRNGLYRD